MIRIAICDDLEEDIEKLEVVIREKIDEQDYLLKTFSDANIMLATWQPYDIVFLDIEMGDKNGIDVGHEIRKRDLHTKIIYVTSHTVYQGAAFSVHAFQYLTKPIVKDVLEKVLKEAIDYISKVSDKDIVTLDANGKLVNLNLHDVYYFEFVNREVKIRTDKKDIYMRTSLKNIMGKIQEKNFGIPHKAFIVNFFKIKRIKHNIIDLTSGETIPVAQKRAAGFRKEYFDFLHKVYDIL